MSDTETSTEIVSLTEKAIAMATKFMSQEESPEGKAFRVGVNAGGCSGFSYDVRIGDLQADDLVHEYEGLKVAVDPASVEFIQGMRLDYEDTIGHAGFVFDNPQAKSTCGCGTSFDA